MNLFDKVKCYRCSQVVPRMDSLIVQTPNGQFRLCKMCYIEVEKGRLNEQYRTVQDNTKEYKGLKVREVDPYELMKEKEKFLKTLKKK